MTTVKKTVREVFEALERNGFGHLRGEWFSIYDDKVEACVLGQAALNLGVQGFDAGVTEEIEGVGVYEEVERYTLLTQLNRFKVNKNSRWYDEDEPEAGSTIIRWNDKGGATESGFALETYAEVTEMAREVLSPHFSKIVTLKLVDTNFRPQADG